MSDSDGCLPLISAMLLGAMILAGFLVFSGYLNIPSGSQSACRAANPGYECVVGWVKGEAFK